MCAASIAILCCITEAGPPHKKDTLKQFHVTFRLCAAQTNFSKELFHKYGYKVSYSIDTVVLSLALRMTSTCLLARVCSAPRWSAGRDTQWTGDTSLSRVNTEIITNIPDCVMMIELLRETNVPWKDLVKRVEYGPDVIQGEDIKWPLVK